MEHDARSGGGAPKTQLSGSVPDLSDPRYRTLIDAIPDAYYRSTRDGRIVDLNAAACRITGYTREELLAMRVTETLFFDPAERQWDDAPASGGNELMTYRLRHKDGSEVWLEEHSWFRTDRVTGELMREGICRDVTDRMRLLQRVQQSEARLRAIIDNLPFDVWLADREGRGLLQNPADIAHWGDYAGRRIEDSQVADEVKEVVITHRRRALAGETVKEEVRFPGENGESRVCYNILSPIRDAQGISGIAGVNIDITELKRAEASLKESEERYRTLVEQSPDGILLGDGERIIFASAAAARILGYENAERLAGKPFRDIVHPSYWELLPRRITNLLERGRKSETHELRVVRGDGSVRTVELIASPVTYKGAKAIQGQIRDLTERKRSEQTMRLQAASLSAAENGVLILDAEGRVVWWNRSVEEFVGTALDQGAGKEVREILAARFELPPHLESMWQRVVSGLSWDGEVRLVDKRGASSVLEVTVTPLRDASGALTHVIVIAQDVTERKALEEKYLQAQKLESIGLLAGGIAHDFNNILGIVMGFCEIMRINANGDPAIVEPLETVVEAARRGASVTRRLLTFARKDVVVRTVVNLNDSLLELKKVMKGLVGENIVLEVTLQDALWDIEVDPGQFDQVVMNLITNARDAITRGGSITLATANVAIDESSAHRHPGLPPGDYVRLQCIDTGSGMSKEVLAHAFEPFFTTKPQGQGTGLGLSTIYGIVKEYDGHIEIESQEGTGTIVSVYIPHFDAPRESHESPPAETKRSRPMSVLVVDDEAPLLEILAESLRSRGYSTLAAHGAGEALQICEARPDSIDLLITDLKMPLMDGIELSERMSVLQPHMKTLFISGYAENDLPRGTGSAAAHFLQKPFELETLLAKVAELG